MTEILKIEADWKEVKNECRNTCNKDATEKPATKEFIKKILISEHSPIRQIRVKWRWAGIKSWISVHFARHWLGWEKWVSTQRSDRTGIDRNKSTQDTPVNMDIEANAQALINVSKFRLCNQAAAETKKYMENLKITFRNSELKELSDVMVPHCVYRCGCPEIKPCQFFNNFINFCHDNHIDILDIQKRYDGYNEYFYLINNKKL